MVCALLHQFIARGRGRPFDRSRRALAPQGLPAGAVARAGGCVGSRVITQQGRAAAGAAGARGVARGGAHAAARDARAPSAAGPNAQPGRSAAVRGGGRVWRSSRREAKRAGDAAGGAARLLARRARGPHGSAPQRGGQCRHARRDAVPGREPSASELWPSARRRRDGRTRVHRGGGALGASAASGGGGAPRTARTGARRASGDRRARRRL